MLKSFSKEPLIYQQFSDIDHLAEVFRYSNRGSSYSMEQLAKAPFKGSLMTLNIPDISIYKLSWNCLVNVVGNKAIDCFSFGTLFQVKGRQPLAHGVPINNNCLFAFGDMEANFITSSEQLQIVLVVIKKDIFWDFAKQFEYFDLDDTFFQTRNAMNLNEMQFVPYHKYLQEIIYLSEYQPQVLQQNSIMEKLIRSDLLPLLLDTLQDTAITSIPPPKARVEIVKATQKFIKANLHHPLTLEDICQAVFASRRSLIYGFEDIFGMGPMSYLKMLRLNGVRRALLVADPQFNKVKEIALNWGFWHLGHFCQDYKKMFGEAPSKTLKKAVGS